MKMRSYWLVFLGSALSVATFVGFLAYNEIRNDKATVAPNLTRPLPPFSLAAHNGTTISQAELLGKVWVADFIFTNCPGPCLKMSGVMQEIQNRVGTNPDVRLVSFTVNPEMDTPPVLAKYAEKFGAKPNWLFLTGEKQKIYDLAQKGFLLSAVDTGDGSGKLEDQFIHDTKFAIVDRSGAVRTYIDSSEPNASAKVAAAVQHYLTSPN